MPPEPAPTTMTSKYPSPADPAGVRSPVPMTCT
jgi:hypothetical protein